ncbi:MAG TPA: hypothetical protein VF253_14480 [Candidatus Limnocylindrales bacterium]|jgi:hypothetical protein
MTKKKKHGGAAGQTIGSILVGFDQQIMRNLPPAQELVEKSTPVRGFSGSDDGLRVVFPDDPALEGDDADGDKREDRSAASDVHADGGMTLGPPASPGGRELGRG